jgi:osmotically-inducible protein OsmY
MRHSVTFTMLKALTHLNSRTTLRTFGMLLVLVSCSGCLAAAVVGGGAAAGSTAAMDQRSLGRHLDDASISSMIDVRLIAEEDLPSRWISAEVVRGDVVLTGYLPKQEQIDRAIYICKHIRGVRSVRSDILIGKPPTRALFSDTLITTNVKRNLFNDPDISGFTVHVETVGGKVYLQGVVATASQRLRAATLAGEVEGVNSIVNLLHIKGKQ